MQSQTLVADCNETAATAQAAKDTSRSDERLTLERLALISEDRSRLNPRRELDILALMGPSAGSDGADVRM